MSLGKRVYYDIPWQVLRVSLLAQNNAYGGWTTVEGTKRNIKLLKQYLKKDPTALKTQRVFNLLAAVRMGNSGQGKNNSKHDNLVQQYLASLRPTNNVIICEDLPSKKELRADIKKMKFLDLQKVYRNLLSRWKKHKDSPYRKELRGFLDLLEERILKGTVS